MTTLEQHPCTACVERPETTTTETGHCADCPRDIALTGWTRVYLNEFGDAYVAHFVENGAVMHRHAGIFEEMEACQFCASAAFPTRWTGDE